MVSVTVTVHHLMFWKLGVLLGYDFSFCLPQNTNFLVKISGSFLLCGLEVYNIVIIIFSIETKEAHIWRRIFRKIMQDLVVFSIHITFTCLEVIIHSCLNSYFERVPNLFRFQWRFHKHEFWRCMFKVYGREIVSCLHKPSKEAELLGSYVPFLGFGVNHLNLFLLVLKTFLLKINICNLV